MLAATLARPSATGYSPTPAGDRLVTAFTKERGGALRDEPGATTRDGGGRRLACPFGRELAAGRTDLLAAVAPDRRLDAGRAERRGEALDDGHRAGGPRRVRDGVHRDEVDVRVVAAQEVDHRGRVRLGVVDAADHRDLVADPPAGRGRVVAGGRDDLRDRPAAVQRDEDVAQRVARGVERDRQRELWSERGQATDAGHDARRRHGDVAGTQPEPVPVVERLDGGQDPVEVEQRLAHPHEHDVGQPLAVRDEAARGETDLVDDLGDLEVAPEPEFAGRAERAADRTAGLARDAQRVPFARARPRPGNASGRIR